MCSIEVTVYNQPKQDVDSLDHCAANDPGPCQKSKLLPFVHSYGVGVTVGVGVVENELLPKPIVGHRFSCHVDEAS